jgi:hypothetical protein
MSSDAITLVEMAIERSAAGTADDDDLNALIESAWRDVLAQQNERKAVAELLSSDPATLDPRLVPFRATIDAGGLTGAEILIVAGTGFASAFAKEFGAAAAKALFPKLQQLWNKYIRPRVSPAGSTKMSLPPVEKLDS